MHWGYQWYDVIGEKDRTLGKSKFFQKGEI